MRERRIIPTLLLLTVLIVVGLVPAAAGAAQGPSLPNAPADPPAQTFKAGELLVKLRAGTSSVSAETLMERHDASRIRFLYRSDVELWGVPAGRELAAALALNADPSVVYAEPNYVYHVFDTVPNDDDYDNQWAHPLINSPAAWDVSTGSSIITIAIIDSGVDPTHPDLAAKLVAGYDFVGGDTDPTDLNGHGTHCAGIAAAITDNTTGIAGMDWDARIMPVRVMDEEGSGFNSDITSGINWAYANGAHVLSLSLGGTSYSQSMQDAVTAAHNAGSLVVAAMGNDRTDGNPTNYPAAYDNVLAVAATTVDDDYAYYSQYGSHCDIAAPGGDFRFVLSEGIYSTLPTYPFYLGTEYGFSQNYDYLQGTSMATPYVSGLAALILSVDATLTPDEVQTVIEDTAVDLGDTGWDEDYGHGRINAGAALLLVSPPPAPVLNPISNPDLNGGYTVDWEPAARATSYTLQEDDTSGFTSPSVVCSGGATHCDLTGRGPGTWYYRVQAHNAQGDSPWSNTRSVGVAPPAPTLNAISNAGNQDAYTVSWSAAPGAFGYLLQEGTTAGFTTVVTRYLGSAQSYNVTGQPAGTWHYRVLAYSNVGDGPWSNSTSTTVDPAALAAPSMLPIDNSDGDGDFTVGWSSVADATGYLLEESSEPYFVSPAVLYSGPNQSYDVTGRAEGSYFYRARASNAGGSGPWAVPSSKGVVPAYVYLPLVLKNYAPVVIIPDIPNGDFEQGQVSWFEQSNHDFDLIVHETEPYMVPPHSGSWATWLGGFPEESCYIEQSLTVSAGGPHLTYWHWIGSDDICGYYFDVGTVVVNGTDLQTFDLCEDNNTGGWVQSSVDLSAYAGQVVTLRFSAVLDDLLNSNWFIDDVAFSSTAVSAPVADAPGGTASPAAVKTAQ